MRLGALRGAASTGRALEWTAVSIKRVGGGRAAETRTCTDGLALLRPLGAVPGDAGPKGWEGRPCPPPHRGNGRVGDARRRSEPGGW